MITKTHTCKHAAPEPRNMGRGAARVARLAAYFARPCRECALAMTVGYGDQFTKLTPEQAAVSTAKQVARVMALYR